MFLFLYFTCVKCCFCPNKLVFDLFPPIDLRASNAGSLETKQRNDFNFVSGFFALIKTHQLNPLLLENSRTIKTLIFSF